MTEINEFPLNVLSCIFLLLKNKHVMIEELLKFFICVVNAQLFKAIGLSLDQHPKDDLEDFEPCNIQNADERTLDRGSLHGLIYTFHEISERFFIQCFGKGIQRMEDLRLCPTLSDPFSTRANTRSQQGLQETI